MGSWRTTARIRSLARSFRASLSSAFDPPVSGVTVQLIRLVEAFGNVEIQDPAPDPLLARSGHEFENKALTPAPVGLAIDKLAGMTYGTTGDLA